VTKPSTPSAAPRPQPATSQDLARFFRRYGWTFERLDDATFRTGFRGKNAAFVALARITEHWVVFTVNPLVRAPDRGWGPAALHALAFANQQANLVKLGLDDDGDAFITVELPTEGFSYAHFQSAIGALSHFSDQLIVPLLQARAVDDRQRFAD
jgi:hypothetical protein